MLSVNKIVKIYSNGRGIQELSFQCCKGEVLALVGENGAGKSTVMKMIAGYFKTSKGKCSFKLARLFI